MAWGSDERRAARLATLAVGAATVLVLLVSLWAASSGPDDPFPGEGIAPDRASTTAPSAPSSTAPPPSTSTGEDPGSGSSWTETVVLVAVGAFVLLFVVSFVALVASMWSGLPRPRRRERSAPREAVDDLDPVESVGTAIVADARAQESLLATGTPRNGIVESWHRFEVQAERSGVPRRSWETSAEFTVRLLDLVAADPAAVTRLAALYREARFSAHELDEGDREAALAALRLIHRGLAAASAGRTAR